MLQETSAVELNIQGACIDLGEWQGQLIIALSSRTLEINKKACLKILKEGFRKMNSIPQRLF